MAATRLIALHKNKGKSVAACLKSRTDYAQNPEKTEQGELVSSYECSPLTVDEEFMLSKRQYELATGRRQKSDVIAYQIRQSFKPGEITAEEANKVGYELAMRFTKGKYAFIVATHTDREHIHNHIIYNSTALDSSRKFRDFLLSGLAVQRLSDLICLEHQLSVIEKKPYRERQKRTLYPPKESNRDRLCSVIDSILAEKPNDYEDFLHRLEQQGYEVKRGKYTSVKGKRQKRFIRFKMLGAGWLPSFPERLLLQSMRNLQCVCRRFCTLCMVSGLRIGRLLDDQLCIRRVVQGNEGGLAQTLLAADDETAVLQLPEDPCGTLAAAVELYLRLF